MFDVNAFVGFATQYSFELLTKEELTTVFTWLGDLLQGKKIKFSKSEIENYKTKIQTVYNICNHTFASHAFHEYYGYVEILKSFRRRLTREIKKELNSMAVCIRPISGCNVPMAWGPGNSSIIFWRS